MLPSIFGNADSVQALQERERLLCTIIQASPASICTIKNRKIVWCNDAFCKLVDYRLDEIVGKTTQFLYLNKDTYETAGADLYRQINETGEGTIETAGLKRGGIKRYIIIRCARVPDSIKKFDTIFTCEDITDRKLAEIALKESEVKFKSIFNHKGTAICIFKQDGLIRECNTVFPELTGYPKADIIDKIKWSDLVVKEDLERMQNYHSLRTRKDTTAPFQYEFRIKRKSGEIRTVMVTVSLIETTRVASLMDITDRKRAEIERDKLKAQLQQAQKLEAIGTLAGGIAHDFNNILSAILGYSELLLEELPMDPYIRPKVEAIHSSGMRARDLVSHILAFSRKDEQARSPIELNQIVEDALRLLRPAIPMTIDITTQLAAACRIIGDYSRIHQIIMNLCTNAYQAMMETGGTLKIILSNESLGATKAAGMGLLPGDYGKLTVSDTGTGIAPEHMDHIFEPYFTTKETGKGTGLGLAAVHGIIKSHNGAILFDSRMGKGTTFEVYLPLTREKPVEQPLTRIPLQGGSESILLVDDEPAILAVGKQMLTELGYRVQAAGNATEALELFAGHARQFDLVITDMTMPGMTGDRLVIELRRIRPAIPIILCTGFSDLVSKEKLETLKVNGFFMKPVPLADMARMVRKVLDEPDSITVQWF